MGVQASHCVVCLSLDVSQGAESEKRDCEKSEVGEEQCLTMRRRALPVLRPIFVSTLRKQEKSH